MHVSIFIAIIPFNKDIRIIVGTFYTRYRTINNRIYSCTNTMSNINTIMQPPFTSVFSQTSVNRMLFIEITNWPRIAKYSILGNNAEY